MTRLGWKVRKVNVRAIGFPYEYGNRTEYDQAVESELLHEEGTENGRTVF